MNFRTVTKNKAIGFTMIVLIFLGYYFFMIPYEFEVNLKAKTTPGDVIQTIRLWDRSLDDVSVIDVDSLTSLHQSVTWKGRNYFFSWNFKVIDDSITKVNIKITEPGKEFINKLLVPVTNTPIEKDAAEIAMTFRDIMARHIEITRVKIEGEMKLDSVFCICRSLTTEQIEKANGMMKDYDLLTSFIESNNLSTKGFPMVRLNKWSQPKGSISFDFCFPIMRTNSLPTSGSFSYKYFKQVKVLKAEYRGNYITSDRAWYELMKKAHMNGYRVTGLPIEYFHDNPSLGMNESNWRADVFLPVEN